MKAYLIGAYSLLLKNNLDFERTIDYIVYSHIAVLQIKPVGCILVFCTRHMCSEIDEIHNNVTLSFALPITSNDV